MCRNLQAKIELGQGTSGGDQSSSSASSTTSSLPPLSGGGGGAAGGGGEQFLRLRLQNIQNSQNSGGSGSGDSGCSPHSNNNSPRGLPMLGPGRNNPAAYGPEDVITLSSNVQLLRNEVDRLKGQLNIAQQQR